MPDAGRRDRKQYLTLVTILDKDEARAKWGADQVLLWRRSYEIAPPEGESLRDTAARVLLFYVREILPEIMRSGPVLVVAHGNSMRAPTMALDGFGQKEIAGVEYPTGHILAYRFAADTRVAERWVISSAVQTPLPSHRH